MAYFPMFVQMDGCRCLVIGEGKEVLRKIAVMQEFGANVSAMTPNEFREECLSDADVVIVATEDKEWNHGVAKACKERKIPVNVVDQQEDCTFIFPSYLKQGDVVAAFGSGGKSPVVTQYLKREMQPFMTEELGDLTELLGSLRDMAKECIPTLQGRKAFYEEILQIGLSTGEIPDEDQIKKILEEMRS